MGAVEVLRVHPCKIARRRIHDRGTYHQHISERKFLGSQELQIASPRLWVTTKAEEGG